jgi:hypothetical protein
MVSEMAETSQGVKPSRWWVVYHVWAGLWLNQAAALGSVYSKLLTGLWLKSVTLESSAASIDRLANRADVLNTIVMLVLVGLGYVGSKRLLAAIDRSKDSPRTKRSVKWVLPIAYPVLAGLAASWIGPLIETAAPPTTISNPLGSLPRPTFAVANPNIVAEEEQVPAPKLRVPSESANWQPVGPDTPIGQFLVQKTKVAGSNTPFPVNNSPSSSIVVGRVPLKIPNPAGFAPLTPQMRSAYQLQKQSVLPNVVQFGV